MPYKYIITATEAFAKFLELIATVLGLPSRGLNAVASRLFQIRFTLHSHIVENTPEKKRIRELLSTLPKATDEDHYEVKIPFARPKDQWFKGLSQEQRTGRIKVGPPIPLLDKPKEFVTSRIRYPWIRAPHRPRNCRRILRVEKVGKKHRTHRPATGTAPNEENP